MVRIEASVCQGEMPARGIKQVQVKVGGEVLPQAHRFVIKLHALGREVVGADDGGVAPGVAAADVTLLDHGDIGDAVVARQVIRGGQPVAARADDHHVVAGFQRPGGREHPRLGVPVR